MSTCNRCLLDQLERKYGKGRVVVTPDVPPELASWAGAVRAETVDGRFLAWFGALGDECECSGPDGW